MLTPATANYTVQWFDANSDEEIKGAETRSGTVGQPVSATSGDMNVSGYTFKADDNRNVTSAILATSGTVLKLYFTENTPVVDTKTIPFTPTVAFRISDENATDLTREQIAQNYSITFTYTDVDGAHTKTLNASTTGATWGVETTGAPTLTWPEAFSVKIKDVAGETIDMAVTQSNFKIGNDDEVIYENTYTTNGSYQTNGTGTVTVSQNSWSLGATTVNYYKLPKAPVEPDTPDLSITKTVADKDGNPVTIAKTGSTVKYTITVTNTGKAEATNVVITDKLPDGLTIDADSITGGGSYGSRTVTWNLGTLAANGKVEVSFEAEVTASGDTKVANTATVDSTETDPETSDPATITGKKMEIKVTKKAGQVSVDETTGVATIPYTVTVTNNGDPLFGLDILDALTEIKVQHENETLDNSKASVTYDMDSFKVNGEKVAAQSTGDHSVKVAALNRGAVANFTKDQPVTLTYNVLVKNLSDVKIVVSLTNKAIGGSWVTGGTTTRMARSGGYDIEDSAEETASVGATVVIPPVEKVTVTFIDGYDNTEIPNSKITDWTKDTTVPTDRYPSVPTHTDKDFNGWDVVVDPTTGNITITAKWTDKTPVEPVTHNVIFNSNGGSSVANQTVNDGETATEPAVPTRTNYRFDGWYLNDEPYDFNTPVTVDIELVAHWTYVPPYTPDPTPTYYTVRYTDGVAGEEVFADQVTGSLTWGAATPAFNGTPTREGYVFLGWSPAVADRVTGNATYTAQWEEIEQPAEHTVTVTPVDEDGNRLGDDVVVTVPEGEDYAVPVPEIEGYTPELTVVTGTMGGEDVVVIVTYTRNETDPDEPDDPGEVDLGDEDTPLVDNPGEEDIGDEDTPLVENPGEEDIGDGDTPLVDVPQTGDFSALWFAALIVSACGLVLLNLKRRKVTED